jgi:hypothetical protein
MPLIAGAVLPIIDYQGVFLFTAGLILVSIPFARSLQVEMGQVPAPVLASAE